MPPTLLQICACVGLLDEDEAEEEEEPPTVSFRIINNYTVTAISEVAISIYNAARKKE